MFMLQMSSINLINLIISLKNKILTKKKTKKNNDSLQKMNVC
jgi:hypothetical protein